MNQIQCYSQSQWTFASDTFVGVCDIGSTANDLVVTNVAVFGTWLKTVIPIPSGGGYDGGDMLQPIAAAVARTIYIMTPTSATDISEVSSYSYTYYASSSCQTQAMFVEAVSDQSDTLLLCSGASSYQSVSTAITFDGITPNAASSSSCGISPSQLLNFDAISSDNAWYGLPANPLL
jgi:hypothetical protein